MAKVLRIADGLAVVAWETAACMERCRPFSVNLLGASSRAAIFTTAWECEEYAIEKMKEDSSLFGGVVRCEGERLVSRVVPG